MAEVRSVNRRARHRQGELRLLQDMRRQLLHPPADQGSGRRTSHSRCVASPRSLRPKPFTPLLGRHLVVDLFRQIDSFPDSHDLEVLDSLTKQNPVATVGAVLALILGDNDEAFQPSVMWLEHAKVLSRLGRTAPRGLVVEQVLGRVDEQAWPALVAHVDFSTDEPDPLLVAMLGRSSGDVLRGRATLHLMYPASGWWGPESEYLRAARDRAAGWRALPDAPDSFHEWLDEAIRAIDDRIETAVGEEAERGY